MIRVQVLSEEKSNDGRVVLDKAHEVPEKQLSTLDKTPRSSLPLDKDASAQMQLQAEQTTKEIVENAPIAVEAQANVPNNTANHLLSEE